MTEPTSEEEGTVEENVSKELKALRSDIKSLADDLRRRINLAGEDAKERWMKLDAERKRFLDKMEQAAEETRADLRRVGSDLKKRLQGLQEEIKSEDEEEGGDQQSRPSES